MKKMLLAALLMFVTFQAHAAVPRDHRVLVVVSELDTHGAEDLRDMYRALENATRTIPLAVLGDDYGRIIRLYDTNATAANFVSTLRNLAADPSIQAIDVILSLHGLPGKVAFDEGNVRVSALKDNLLTVRSVREQRLVTELKRKLRLMYNLSCFGKTHNEAFMEMGFDASIGSKGVNANAEIEFPSALGLWQFGASVEQALAPTNNPAAIAANDQPLRAFGAMTGREMLQQVDSMKVILGNKHLTINSNPQ